MKLVLIDRDGVLNVSPGKGYVTHPDQLRLIPGSAKAVRLLNQADIRVCVVTNQSIVGQGRLTLGDLQDIHERLHFLLKQQGAYIDQIYLCTDPAYAPTDRRKPNPGMLFEALQDFKAEASETPFIGDAITDLEAAHRAGCIPYLVRTGHGEEVERQGVPPYISPMQVHDTLLKTVESLMTLNKRMILYD